MPISWSSAGDFYSRYSMVEWTVLFLVPFIGNQCYWACDMFSTICLVIQSVILGYFLSWYDERSERPLWYNCPPLETQIMTRFIEAEKKLDNRNCVLDADTRTEILESIQELCHLINKMERIDELMEHELDMGHVINKTNIDQFDQ